MNYTDIAAGMTGAQFIDAINGNNEKSEIKFNAVDEAILLRVIGNNIKQIRSNNGKLEFTLDGTTWVSTDNVVWGNLTGDITAQTDLMNALNAKANQTDLNTTNAAVSSLSSNLDSTNTNVAANTSAITNNTTAIGALQAKQAKQVSSDDILYIRLGANDYMQYSLDGITWENVSASASTVWGDITGDITNQTDLLTMFNNKANIQLVSSHITNLDNPHQVDAEQVGLGNVDNTSDADKPISTAAQAAIDDIYIALNSLANDKLDKSEDIQEIVYVTLNEWNELRDLGELLDNVIYIVN